MPECFRWNRKAEPIAEESDHLFGDVEAILADHEIQFDDAIVEGDETFAENDAADLSRCDGVSAGKR